jgi:hypothetical protein
MRSSQEFKIGVGNRAGSKSALLGAQKADDLKRFSLATETLQVKLKTRLMASRYLCI